MYKRKSEGSSSDVHETFIMILKKFRPVSSVDIILLLVFQPAITFFKLTMETPQVCKIFSEIAIKTPTFEQI